MSTRSDPLVARSVDSPSRLFYAQGVLLDAQDFSDEQTYHRGRQARALQYLFGTGTVAGLRVQYEADTDEVVVLPGVALDPLGRLLELPRRRCLRLAEWFAAQRAEDLSASWATVGPDSMLVADVFVRFVVCERGKTPAFASGPFDALDAVQPSRLQDTCELGLCVREEAGLARDPNDVPVPDDRALLAALPADPVARRRAIEDHVLDAWRDGTEDWQQEQPPRLVEHLPPRVSAPGQVDHTAVGRDPTSVLLARLYIGVDTSGATPALLGLDPDTGNPNNRVRRFVEHAGYLTRPANRGGP